jgi:hypothetical protein
MAAVDFQFGFKGVSFVISKDKGECLKHLFKNLQTIFIVNLSKVSWLGNLSTCICHQFILCFKNLWLLS